MQNSIDQDLQQAMIQVQVHPKRRLNIIKRVAQGQTWLSKSEPTCRYCKLYVIDYVSSKMLPGFQCRECKHTTTQQIQPFAQLMPKGLTLEFIGSEEHMSNKKKNSIRRTQQKNNIKETIEKIYGEGTFSSEYHTSSKLLQKVNHGMFTDIPPAHIQTQNQIIKNRVNQEFLPLRIGLSSIEGAGNGVFATEKLPKDSIVCSYVGEIIMSTQFWPPSDSLYGIGWFHQGKDPRFVVIQPIRKLNVGRFINSADIDHCNCTIQKCLVKGAVCLYISTLRQIEENQQLKYHYGQDYTFGDFFDPSSNKKDQVPPGNASRQLTFCKSLQDVAECHDLIPSEVYNSKKMPRVDLEYLYKVEANQVEVLQKQKQKDLKKKLLFWQNVCKLKAKGRTAKRPLIEGDIQVAHLHRLKNYHAITSNHHPIINKLLNFEKSKVWNPLFLFSMVNHPMRRNYLTSGAYDSSYCQELTDQDILRERRAILLQYFNLSHRLFPDQMFSTQSTKFACDDETQDKERGILQKQIFIRKFLFFGKLQGCQVYQFETIKDFSNQLKVIEALIDLSSGFIRSGNFLFTEIKPWLRSTPTIRPNTTFQPGEFTQSNYSLQKLISKIALYQRIPSDSKAVSLAFELNQLYLQKILAVQQKVSKKKLQTATLQMLKPEESKQLQKNYIELTVNQTAILYRQFSRQKYNKFKHQFPRMNQSEIISKLIKQWYGLFPQQKKQLYQQYDANNFINGISDESESQQKIESSGQPRSRSRQKKQKRQTPTRIHNKTGVQVFVRSEKAKSDEGSDYERQKAYHIDVSQSQSQLEIKQHKNGRITNFDYGKPENKQKSLKEARKDKNRKVKGDGFLLYFRILNIINKAVSRQTKPSDEMIHDFKAATQRKDFHSFNQLYDEESLQKSCTANVQILKSKCRLCKKFIQSSHRKLTSHLTQQHCQMYWWQWILVNFSAPKLFIFVSLEGQSNDLFSGKILTGHKDRGTMNAKANQFELPQQYDVGCWAIQKGNYKQIKHWSATNSNLQITEQVFPSEIIYALPVKFFYSVTSQYQPMRLDLREDFACKKQLEFDIIKQKLSNLRSIDVRFTQSLQLLDLKFSGKAQVICYQVQHPIHFGLCINSKFGLFTLDGQQERWPVPMIKSYMWQKQKEDFTSSFIVLEWIERLDFVGLGVWLQSQKVCYDDDKAEQEKNKLITKLNPEPSPELLPKLNPKPKPKLNPEPSLELLPIMNPETRRTILTTKKIRRSKQVLKHLGIVKRDPERLYFRHTKKTE